MRELERRVVLVVLTAVARAPLRDGLPCGRAWSAGNAQRDPLIEYQREGYDLFNSMMEGIKEESVRQPVQPPGRGPGEPDRRGCGGRGRVGSGRPAPGSARRPSRQRPAWPERAASRRRRRYWRPGAGGSSAGRPGAGAGNAPPNGGPGVAATTRGSGARSGSGGSRGRAGRGTGRADRGTAGAGRRARCPVRRAGRRPARRTGTPSVPLPAQPPAAAQPASTARPAPTVAARSSADRVGGRRQVRRSGERPVPLRVGPQVQLCHGDPRNRTTPDGPSLAGCGRVPGLGRVPARLGRGCARGWQPPTAVHTSARRAPLARYSAAYSRPARADRAVRVADPPAAGGPAQACGRHAGTAPAARPMPDRGPTPHYGHLHHV